jgi:hypothetical protein
MLTLASRTPGTAATAFSTWCGISSAEGQFGVVKVISTAVMRACNVDLQKLRRKLVAYLESELDNLIVAYS